MKRFPIAYYLLLIYTTVILRPLIPMAADAWMHTFNEAIHISTIHAKYGSNHLEKQLAGAESENNKTPSTIKSQEPVAPHIVRDNCVYAVGLKSVGKQYNVFAQANPISIFISLQLPPPKFS